MIPIFKKSIDIDVIATEIVTVLAKDRSSFKKELLGIYKSQQDIETVGFLYAISAYSITVTECSDKEKLMFMAALAKQFAKEIGLSKNNINYLLDQWTKYQASLNTDYSLDFLAKNNCLISVNGKQHINYPMLIWLEYLKIRGVQQNNSFFIVAQTYILSLFVNTTKFIREYLKKYKINYAAYGANWLELIPLVHEPEEKQLQDIFKDCQNDFGHVVLEKITSGLSCDQLPNGTGDLGTLLNPIPVNGIHGEIKYLAKLRGLTGKPVLFHRLASFDSETCNDPVDGYETVCTDGTQWNTLYFDMYHPRRSNLAPKGYVLNPYSPSLKEDAYLGLGVDFHVDNFPYGLPDAISTFFQPELVSKKIAGMVDGFLKQSDFSKRESQT